MKIMNTVPTTLCWNDIQLGHTAEEMLSQDYLNPTTRRIRVWFQMTESPCVSQAHAVVTCQVGFGHGSKPIPARACFALHSLYQRRVKTSVEFLHTRTHARMHTHAHEHAHEHTHTHTHTHTLTLTDSLTLVSAD